MVVLEAMKRLWLPPIVMPASQAANTLQVAAGEMIWNGEGLQA